jgi:hypothetical protein
VYRHSHEEFVRTEEPKLVLSVAISRLLAAKFPDLSLGAVKWDGNCIAASCIKLIDSYRQLDLPIARRKLNESIKVVLSQQGCDESGEMAAELDHPVNGYNEIVANYKSCKVRTLETMPMYLYTYIYVCVYLYMYACFLFASLHVHAPYMDIECVRCDFDPSHIHTHSLSVSHCAV